jgi:hypothetical protein
MIHSYNKSQRDALFLKFIFDKELNTFRTDLLFAPFVTNHMTKSHNLPTTRLPAQPQSTAAMLHARCTYSFFRTCPHFQGLNYRPGGIYQIKANVRKLGVF